MGVAVKTLREDPKREKEEDFLKEAAIMAKFNHPNMVHLIGVCFDRQPYYIVLELLAGGDLQKFLRENRNTPERPSLLTMKDLLFCALDVAKGCRYMESKRFIHRDIAARNCLLSSKGPGRVVKIADFGMSRDIYRSDYYRKGGKAMLPIKWMPPEAFLDGIFTSKTDVWSFGILLWEVFSLGRSPYPGQHNTQVMELVVRGGRLGSPTECPVSIYKVMADCWNPTPEDRPTFITLLEHLTACTQDASIMNAPLPNILGPTASERDDTVIRPPNGEEFCLAVPDYLVPLPPGGSSNPSVASGSGYVPESQRQQMSSCTPPAVTSPAAPHPRPVENLPPTSGDCWETSFILPNSKVEPPVAGSGHDVPLAAGEEAKLISLDTPQPTPTTIQPPLSFASQLDGITTISKNRLINWKFLPIPDKIPYGGRCDFEEDWCGWRDSGKTTLTWSRHTGSSPTHDTGPDGDHTMQHLQNNTSGYYMLVNMNQHQNNTEKNSIIGFASNAIMVSKTFNPPPSVHGNPDSAYRNSCVVRFFIHQFGKNPGSINLSVVEMKEKENITTTLWWSTKNQGSDWLRAEYVLPNITSK